MLSYRNARSFLYTPAIRAAGHAKAGEVHADVAVIDLEDSVPPAARVEAREAAAAWLQRERPCVSAMRINSLRTPDGLRDLLALQAWPVAPELIVLTMVDHAEEVRVVRDQLASLARPPALYVTVETARCLLDLAEVARASDGLILGSADLAANLGVEITWESMLHARHLMVTAAAAAGIPAVDTACYDLRGPETLERECADTRRLGFDAKVAIHPRQVEAINRHFAPGDEEVASARAVLDEFERSQGRISTVAGMMIGPPFVALARKTLARAQQPE